MAKFTKLNLGDIVASSGGRVFKKLSTMTIPTEQLPSPYGVTIDGNTLTWGDYSILATSFDIFVDGVVKATVSAPTNSFDLSALGLADGTYSITVVSKAEGYLDSEPSEAVTYTVGGDELAGTWVFNSPAFAIPNDFYSTCGQRVDVKFVSNGRSFNYIAYTDTGSSAGDELYYDSRLVIEGGQTSSGAWIDEGYSTITIEDNLADVTNGSTLLTWLKANATKQ